jgi:adenosylcobinamide kinase / adenosylcobinamide-phosphate guanylyltransferase
MLTLILGGARSGKSRYAQTLCASSAQVVYLATAGADLIRGDDEMRRRVARHRADRPAHWVTIEEPLDLARAVREVEVGATLLLDCVTLWISNLLYEHAELTADEQEERILTSVNELIAAVRWRAQTIATVGEVILVSNEVGSGLVPEHPVGRAFRDLHGLANQRLAQAADRVLFIVASLPLTLKA